jgi:hypothetical protein
MRYPALNAAVDTKSELRSVHASACRLRLIVYRQPIHNLATSLHADQVPDVLQRHSLIRLVSMAMRLLRRQPLFPASEQRPQALSVYQVEENREFCYRLARLIQ